MIFRDLARPFTALKQNLTMSWNMNWGHRIQGSISRTMVSRRLRICDNIGT